MPPKDLYGLVIDLLWECPSELIPNDAQITEVGLPLGQMSRVQFLRSSSPNATISLPLSASGLQLQL